MEFLNRPLFNLAGQAVTVGGLIVALVVLYVIVWMARRK